LAYAKEKKKVVRVWLDVWLKGNSGLKKTIPGRVSVEGFNMGSGNRSGRLDVVKESRAVRVIDNTLGRLFGVFIECDGKEIKDWENEFHGGKLKKSKKKNERKYRRKAKSSLSQS